MAKKKGDMGISGVLLLFIGKLSMKIAFSYPCIFRGQA
jgi:hypothetical protein